MSPKERMSVIEQNKINEIISERYNEERKELDVYSHKDEWMLVLKSRDWSGLRKLLMYDCGIDDNNIVTLVNEHLPYLQTLWLHYNKITDVGMNILLNWSLSNLIQLNLGYNKIGSKGAKIFAKIQFPKIQKMRLYGCHFGDEGTKHLTKNKWSNLQILYISDNQIKISGFQAIATMVLWKKLKQLHVKYYDEIAQFIGYISLTMIEPRSVQISIRDNQDDEGDRDINLTDLTEEIFQNSRSQQK